MVLGTTSMLGREVERQLRIEGVDVIRAGRAADNDVVIDLGSGKPPIYERGGVVDAIIHCASAFEGDDPVGVRENFRVNTLGALDVLEVAKQMGCRRFVYAGSLSSESLAEPDRSMTSYGLSKLEGEHILEWGMTRRGGTFCSLRLTQLCDTEGACCKHQPWFGRIVAYASQGLTLRMPASEGSRNFLHVSDAARMLIDSARRGLSGTYSVTHPKNVDLYTLAVEACRIFGRGGLVLIDRDKQPFRKIAFPHDSRVFDIVGYEPKIEALDVLHLIREAGTATRFGPVDVQ